jgi:hypothetical protein
MQSTRIASTQTQSLKRFLMRRRSVRQILRRVFGTHNGKRRNAKWRNCETRWERKDHQLNDRA